MKSFPSDLIDALGGTTVVARLTKSAPSTVHSWRTVGLNEARLDHLRLAAREAGKSEVFDTVCAAHDVVVTATGEPWSPGKIVEASPQVAR